MSIWACCTSASIIGGMYDARDTFYWPRAQYHITSPIYRTRYLCAEQRGPIDGTIAGDCRIRCRGTLLFHCHGPGTSDRSVPTTS
jgi:hypothetical protein